MKILYIIFQIIFQILKKNYLNKLKEIQNKLMENEVKQILKLEIPNAEKYKKKAKEIKKLDNSLFFKKIYENEKK